MKRFLRSYVLYTVTLYVVSKIASGLNYQNSLSVLFVAGLALTGAEMLAKPIINLLLMPLNLVTFNAFRWVASAVVLYLVTLLVTDFKVEYFDFSGVSSKWIDLPAVRFEGQFMSFLAFSFLLSLILGVLFWLFKK